MNPCTVHNRLVVCTGGRLCLDCLRFYADKGQELKPSYRPPSQEPTTPTPGGVGGSLFEDGGEA